MNDAAMLSRCRDLHAGIAPGIWTRVHDGDGAFVEARGEMGELIAVARFTAHASEEEIEFAVEAPRMVGFLLSLVDRAIRAGRLSATPRSGGEVDRAKPETEGGISAAVKGPPSVTPCGRDTSPPDGVADGRRGDARRARDYAAQAAMACAKPAFKAFLMERHGLESPATDERATQKLRGILGVTSRRELNDGGQAAERWRAMMRDFDGWRKAG